MVNRVALLDSRGFGGQSESQARQVEGKEGGFEEHDGAFVSGFC